MASTAFLMFGRFQPPTKGHEQLCLAALELAAPKNADVVLFISKTQDTKENPLSHTERKTLIQTRFPQIVVGPETVRTPYDALSWAKQQNYTRLVLLGGSDRLSDFRRIVRDWKTKEDSENTCQVFAKEVPRNDIDVVSGTEARKFARQGNLRAFKKLLISGLPPSMIVNTLNKIQSRLGMLEEVQMSYLSFTTFTQHLTEADDEQDDVVLQQASKEAEEKDETVPQPDETPVSADELPDKITQQKGSIDAREAERVPSDTPENQSKLIIHPIPRIKNEFAKRLQQKIDEVEDMREMEDAEKPVSAEELLKQR